jgi:bifunctional non-homologous end joining protein LigD
MLPAPMLSRSARLPTGGRWAFEVKWDGFRAIVSTEDGLRVRSRRGWNMTDALPELRQLPPGLVVDGEVVAFNDQGDPHFPLLARRVLNYDRTIRAHLMVFDLPRLDGEDMTVRRYRERRSILDALDLNGAYRTTPCAFDDGDALRAAVCERGLEGVVAKKTEERYWPGARRWIKWKNPAYWRRESEVKGVLRSIELRSLARV